MTEGLLISVVIPTYRRIDQTIEAVKSVVNQTIPVFEIIVVQDEISPALSEALQNQNLLTFVKIIEIEHSGLPAKVRNVGISQSKGNWIGFLDSDDVWFPEKLEKQVGYINNLKLDCVSSSSPRTISAVGPKGIRVTLKRLLKNNFIINSSVLVKKDALIRIGGIPEARNLIGVEDYAAWLRLCSFVNWFHFEEDVLVYENLAEDRLSFDLKKSTLNHYFAILAYVEWLISKGNKLLGTRVLLKLVRFAILADKRRDNE
jgi:teichuronic acid biosynthesis glycosyltransferase TuaG